MGHTVFGIGGRPAGRSGYLARLFCLISALVLVAGCQDGRQNFLTTGIGSDLAAPDVARTATLQNRYFDYLCEQATYGSPKLGARCTGADWDLIVQQGMNDIDRRCDAYLQWLDNRKRSKGPWISQIGDTAAATSAILPVIGTGTKAITIVAQAFQLVTKSVENYHSRLLLEIESSTIHSIVLKARYDFRKHLKEKKVTFNNKPEAEHTLRSYLRLCLPFAIEAKINNYSTLGASGNAPDAGNTLGDLPVVGPLNPGAKFGSGGRNGGGIQTPEGFDKVFVNPKKYGKADLELLQNALCLQGQGVGSIGSKTMAAIQIYEDTFLSAIDFGDLRQPNKNGLIDDFEFNFITSFPSCEAGKYKNMFERINYDIVPDDKAVKTRINLINLLNARFQTSIGTDVDFDDNNLRELIERARTAYGASDFDGFATRQMTQELLNMIRAGPPPNG